MVLDSGIQELSGLMRGLTYDDYYSQENSMGSFLVDDSQHDYYSQENSMGSFLVDDSQPFLDHGGSIYLQGMIPSANPSVNPGSIVTKVNEGGSPEDCEIISDVALDYIRRMLMEEDIDEKVSIYQEESTLRAAAQPFYDILGQKYPPLQDKLPVFNHLNLESPDESSSRSSVTDSSPPQDSVDYKRLQAFPASLDYSSQSPISSSSSVSNVMEPFEEPLITTRRIPEHLVESLLAWQFRRGVEEAQKFLPSSDRLVIDLEASGISFPRSPRKGSQLIEVKAEEEKEYMSFGSRVRKNPHGEDLDLMEGRNNKQSAVSSAEPLRSEMFDSVLLCQGEKCGTRASTLREMMQNATTKNSDNGQTKGSGGGRSRGKKQTKKEVVDLRTLLIHCAQAVAADDRRTANELLKQIRQHSSPDGDGSQRLAYCFADGLEARLAGTGSQKYHKLMAKRTTATDMLKAYHLYLAACPFKKVSHFFSNQTILNVAEKASKVHIIDFGIFYGFQWPCLIQRLSNREGGPPELRITGIDVPQPGFRPTERIEETGQRLTEYAKSFKVPFKYQVIASKWETIRVEDLNIEKDEVVIVNCLYRFRNLVDETVAVDSPRNRVLNTIRQMNPDVFIHGIVNGSYSAPFFVTRFREALFHFSALFDMLQATVPRVDEQRLLIERDLFGREALNVIACEGPERVERPESYKQWQVRNLRAGFNQLPLNPEIMKKAKEKVRAIYHKDFVIDEDSQWLLQGWKGRIIYAVSTWKPNRV